MEPYSKPALQHFFGRDKLALAQAPIEPPPVDDVEKKKPESHAVRNVAMGAAAASPFLGLIGQKPIIHDPHMNQGIRRFRSMAELSREAQPGDVLLTSKPGGSFWKSFIKPLSGSELYHAQPVVARWRGHGTTLSAGEHDEPAFHRSLKAFKDSLDRVQDAALNQEYPDIQLMRPKTKMTPEQLKAYTTTVLKRGREAYDPEKAQSIWWKDIFVPKVFDKSEAKPPPICEGNVCSTVPAMAHAAAGMPGVVPGKAPEDVFPSDYLRSENFVPVGVRLKNEYPMHPMVRKALPYAARGALGLGMAGAVYGVSKDPALASVPLGAMAGSKLMDKIVEKSQNTKRQLPYSPGITGLWAGWGDADPAERKEMLKGYGLEAAGTLGGAALAYGGTRAAQHLVKKFMQRKAEREAAQQQGR